MFSIWEDQSVSSPLFGRSSSSCYYNCGLTNDAAFIGPIIAVICVTILMVVASLIAHASRQQKNQNDFPQLQHQDSILPITAPPPHVYVPVAESSPWLQSSLSSQTHLAGHYMGRGNEGCGAPHPVFKTTPPTYPSAQTVYLPSYDERQKAKISVPPLPPVTACNPSSPPSKVNSFERRVLPSPTYATTNSTL